VNEKLFKTKFKLLELLLYILALLMFQLHS